MKNSIFFIFFTFLTVSMHSQSSKIVYMDEQNEEIDFIRFRSKLESGLFIQSVIIKDTSVFKKLHLKEIFGKIESKEKSQLNKLFLNRYRVDSSNIWYIHYSMNEFDRNNKSKMKYGFADTLVNGSKYKKKEYITRKVANGRIFSNDPDTITKFFKIVNKYELNKVKNPLNTTLLHLDNMKRHLFIDVEGRHNNYHEDHNLIIKNKFRVRKNMNNLIIIHPDGSYYVSKNKSGFNRKELFKFKSFKREEKKWRRKYEKVN